MLNTSMIKSKRIITLVLFFILCAFFLLFYNSKSTDSFDRTIIKHINEHEFEKALEVLNIYSKTENTYQGLEKKMAALNNIIQSLNSFSKLKKSETFSDPLQTLQFLRSLRAQLAIHINTVSEWNKKDLNWKPLLDIMNETIPEMTDFERKKLTAGKMEEIKRHQEAAKFQNIIINPKK